MTKNKPSNLTHQPHLGAVMAKPFIAGARIQLERYLEAQRFYITYKANGIDKCMYELSSLFEHLATVARYLELCGVDKLANAQTIFDIRNHIRHDIREEFDKDGKAKTDRAARLGINPGLQGQVVFSDGGVTVGETELKADAISNFLDMAETTINALMFGLKIETSDDETAAQLQPASHEPRPSGSS